MLRMVDVGPQSVTQKGLPPTAASAAFTLPRDLYNAIMLILIPCESAIRRLIVIAARGLALKPFASRSFPAGLVAFAHESLTRSPSFQLLDPRKQFGIEAYNNNPEPYFGALEPFDPALAYRQAVLAAIPVNATPLFNRLRAMRIALNDLPRQARRLARWQARMQAALAARTVFRPILTDPLRPGLPPGYRRKALHEIDAVLKDVHYFANEIDRPDTG